MNIETKDISHLVSIEKSAKKRRLLKTKQFSVHAGSAILSKMIEGSTPQFEKENYDAQGNEKQIRKTRKVTKPATTPDGEATTVEVAEEPEVEQSFFQKYWWHLLVGFVLIQTMAGGADDEG